MKDKSGTCPLLKKKCIGEDCMFNVVLRGVNPNTGLDVDEQGCAIAWLPLLLIEGSDQSRRTVSAVEGLRNEVASGPRRLEGQ